MMHGTENVKNKKRFSWCTWG